MALDVDGVDTTVHSQLDKMASVGILYDIQEKMRRQCAHKLFLGKYMQMADPFADISSDSEEDDDDGYVDQDDDDDDNLLI